MKFITAWLMVMLFGSFAVCSNWAGPYEAIWVWYAYAMEVESTGGVTHSLASGCIGTGRGGSCKFDELMSHLLNRQITTSVGDRTIVDLDDTAHELIQSFGRGQFRLDPVAMFPVNAHWANSVPSYEELFGDVMTGIQKSRKDLGNRIDDLLTGARDAMGQAHSARLVEQHTVHIKKFNEELAHEGVTWKVETRHRDLPAWGEFEAVDIDATLNAHPAGDDQHMVQRVVDRLQAGNSAYTNHQRILATNMEFTNTLWGSCP